MRYQTANTLSIVLKKIPKRICLLNTLFVLSIVCIAQKRIPLYEGKIPNSTGYQMKQLTLKWDGKFGGYQNVSQPELEIYLPPKEKSTGAAVVICPGGGYQMLSYRLEGTEIAKTFARHGIAAFILKYRLPSDSIMVDRSIGPLQDAQQAIKMVRDRAGEWAININRVGIMGFSAGGHLAATAGTHFDSSFIPNPAHTNLRPDFMVLVYPVISMQIEFTHISSRQHLIGEEAPSEKVNYFSNELQVNAKTPPAWITHTGDDSVVTAENSILFYKALVKNHIPAEMHLFPKGDHGFVLSQPTETWMAAVFSWMKANSWLTKK